MGGRQALLSLGLILLVLAVPATAGSPEAFPVTIEPEGDNRFDPAVIDINVRNAEPTAVQWNWGPGGTTEWAHNVRSSDGLFKSGNPSMSDTLTRAFSAGTYPYFCQVHPGMTGKIRAKTSHIADGGPNPNFPVIWALPNSQTGDAYDVRFRVEGGPWRTWKESTRRRSAVFGKRNNPVNVVCGRTYEFQARSKKSNNPSKRSGWSPIHEYLACD